MKTLDVPFSAEDMRKLKTRMASLEAESTVASARLSRLAGSSGHINTHIGGNSHTDHTVHLGAGGGASGTRIGITSGSSGGSGNEVLIGGGATGASGSSGAGAGGAGTSMSGGTSSSSSSSAAGGTSYGGSGGTRHSGSAGTGTGQSGSAGTSYGGGAGTSYGGGAGTGTSYGGGAGTSHTGGAGTRLGGGAGKSGSAEGTSTSYSAGTSFSGSSGGASGTTFTGSTGFGTGESGGHTDFAALQMFIQHTLRTEMESQAFRGTANTTHTNIHGHSNTHGSDLFICSFLSAFLTTSLPGQMGPAGPKGKIQIIVVSVKPQTQKVSLCHFHLLHSFLHHSFQATLELKVWN